MNVKLSSWKPFLIAIKEPLSQPIHFSSSLFHLIINKLSIACGVIKVQPFIFILIALTLQPHSWWIVDASMIFHFINALCFYSHWSIWTEILVQSIRIIEDAIIIKGLAYARLGQHDEQNWFIFKKKLHCLWPRWSFDLKIVLKCSLSSQILK